MIRAVVLAALLIGLALQAASPSPIDATKAGSPEMAPRRLEALLATDGTLAIPPGFVGSLDTHGWRMELTEAGAPRFVPDGAQGWQPEAVGDDSNWSGDFPPNGVDGVVYAIAISGNDVYIGGPSIKIAGTAPANGIARYNTATSSWSSLGFGLFGIGLGNVGVNAIAVVGTNVFVGGVFQGRCLDAYCTASSSDGLNNIARFDTFAGTWHSLGNGLDRDVYALHVKGAALYAGGSFQYQCADATCSATQPAAGLNRIARWDGATWADLDDGLNQTVYAIGSTLLDLFVGGTFTRRCSNADCSVLLPAEGLNRVARYRIDMNTWFDLGNGLRPGATDSAVFAVEVNGSNVYVGGGFTGQCTDATCAGLPIAAGLRNVGVWSTTGNNWASLDFGLNNSVKSLAFVGGSLYAGGELTRLCTGLGNCAEAPANGVNFIARWDGADWNSLDQGVNGAVWALAGAAGQIYAGGEFDRICGNPTCSFVSGTQANSIATFALGSWNPFGPVGNSPNGPVIALLTVGDNVYVGGSFLSVGALQVNNVARWNRPSNTWSAVAAGFNGAVHALALYNGQVVAGGDFTAICSDAACGVPFVNGQNRIAVWDGDSWERLGNGVNGRVRALAVDGSTLYLGGDFTRLCANVGCGAVLAASGTNRIARWDGAAYGALGLGFISTVYALAAGSGTVDAGGSFDALCGDVSCPGAQPPSGLNHIAHWNGADWTPLANGLNGNVHALIRSGGDLFVGGLFHRSCLSTNCAVLAPQIGLNNLTRWDGTSWFPVGLGFDQRVHSFVLSGGVLYAGGRFSAPCQSVNCAATDDPTRRVARWEPGLERWLALGSGTNDEVNALTMGGGFLFAGGDFTAAGGKASGRFARFGEIADLAIGATVAPVTVEATKALAFSVVVTNTGPGSAAGAVVTATLPAGLTPGAATPSQGSCSGTAPFVCILGAIPLGGTATIQMTATAAVVGPQLSMFVVGSATVDPVASNDRAGATATVVPPPPPPAPSYFLGPAFLNGPLE